MRKATMLWLKMYGNASACGGIQEKHLAIKLSNIRQGMHLSADFSYCKDIFQGES